MIVSVGLTVRPAYLYSVTPSAEVDKEASKLRQNVSAKLNRILLPQPTGCSNLEKSALYWQLPCANVGTGSNFWRITKFSIFVKLDNIVNSRSSPLKGDGPSVSLHWETTIPRVSENKKKGYPKPGYPPKIGIKKGKGIPIKQDTFACNIVLSKGQTFP